MAYLSIHSNGGRLLLTKEWMTEVHKPNRYFRRIARSEVARIFRSKDPYVYATFWGAQQNNAGNYPKGRFFDLVAECHASKNKVIIGCTRFSGENVTKLRKWALKKSAKKN